MNNKVLFTTSFILFILFQTNFCFCSAKSQPSAVRDIFGRKLRSGGIIGGIGYVILPAIIAGPDPAGGFLISNNTCPPQVIQDDDEFSHGMVVYFTPLDLKKGVIRTSSDVNIRFFGESNCSSSLVWKIQEKDALTGEYFVGVGGVLGHPGPQTVNSWFKIEEYKLAYKLRFCPSVCKTCKVICKDVGIVKDKNGKRRLALSDVPFEVIFHSPF
ncbi:OLC1v1013950C1 [Oldenlandia corymbosa var. corymbosa]|uniref:OLC1v1013950C1 n=1 Tax=Oldenlandia corymbosa var. corymbosa TaxID=529605 RepID=A0AAV1E2U0_OLDCO|nr:OLC1v1013950C1 [Oldenlandia corymbosa var. corymbosa]